MITFLAGGTGTPKLLDGATRAWDPDGSRSSPTPATTSNSAATSSVPTSTPCCSRVAASSTARRGGDRGRHDDDPRGTPAARGGCRTRNSPRYLDDDKAQIAGREIGRWRRFSGVGEFMEIGDRDRAVHLTRTGLLDEGHTLTEAIRTLADAFDLDVDLLPMSDDPVATLIHTEAGETIHFQEYWVARRGTPPPSTWSSGARRTRSRPPLSREAFDDPVVIGPSNPVTSVGPMLALPGVEAALSATPVVAVSPFVGDEVFSGPAADLMMAGCRPRALDRGRRGRVPVRGRVRSRRRRPDRPPRLPRRAHRHPYRRRGRR